MKIRAFLSFEDLPRKAQKFTKEESFIFVPFCVSEPLRCVSEIIATRLTAFSRIRADPTAFNLRRLVPKQILTNPPYAETIKYIHE